MSRYPQIDLSEWPQVGEGYNGQAFVSDANPGVMLKLVRREMGAASKVEQEFRAAKTAYEIGLPTPPVRRPAGAHPGAGCTHGRIRTCTACHDYRDEWLCSLHERAAADRAGGFDPGRKRSGRC